MEHPIRLATDLESNHQYENCKYVVQVESGHFDGWVDSKKTGNTIDETVKAARALINDDSAWMTEKRTGVRIVKNRKTKSQYQG